MYSFNQSLFQYLVILVTMHLVGCRVTRFVHGYFDMAIQNQINAIWLLVIN